MIGRRVLMFKLKQNYICYDNVWHFKLASYYLLMKAANSRAMQENDIFPINIQQTKQQS